MTKSRHTQVSLPWAPLGAKRRSNTAAVAAARNVCAHALEQVPQSEVGGAAATHDSCTCTNLVDRPCGRSTQVQCARAAPPQSLSLSLVHPIHKDIAIFCSDNLTWFGHDPCPTNQTRWHCTRLHLEQRVEPNAGAGRPLFRQVAGRVVSELLQHCF